MMSLPIALLSSHEFHCDVRWVGIPPLWQIIAWSTEKLVPQAHFEVTFGIGHPYRRPSASLKAPLDKQNPCSSIGKAFSHADAPGSTAHSINLRPVGSNSFQILSASTFCSSAFLLLHRTNDGIGQSRIVFKRHVLVNNQIY